MKPVCFFASLILLVAAQPAYTQGQSEFSEAELDQMLAPIALYPDSLLAQILIAATYPLEVVEAARWSRQNSHLEGEAAVNAAAGQNWDPSVRALVAFPRILAHMDDDLTWTRNLGDAFLMQPDQVMESIQYLRQEAYNSGYLRSMNEVRVIQDREIIIIEPANSQVIFIPYYNPYVIYGGWWWSAYPPVYWDPPSQYFVGTRIIWVGGYRVPAGYFVTHWDWPRRQVVVVRHYHQHHHTVVIQTQRDRSRELDDAERWHHDPVHRRGVRYRSEELEREYHRRSASSPGREGISRERADQIRDRVRDNDSEERNSGFDYERWLDRRDDSESRNWQDRGSDRTRDRDDQRTSDEWQNRNNRPSVELPEQDRNRPSVNRPSTSPERGQTETRDRRTAPENRIEDLRRERQTPAPGSNATDRRSTVNERLQRGGAEETTRPATALERRRR